MNQAFDIPRPPLPGTGVATATSLDSRLRGDDGGVGSAAGDAVAFASGYGASEATSLGSRFRGNDRGVGDAAGGAVAFASGDSAAEATSLGSRFRGNDGVGATANVAVAGFTTSAAHANPGHSADLSSRHPREGGDLRTLEPATKPAAAIPQDSRVRDGDDGDAAAAASGSTTAAAALTGAPASTRATATAPDATATDADATTAPATTDPATTAGTGTAIDTAAPVSTSAFSLVTASVDTTAGIPVLPAVAARTATVAPAPAPVFAPPAGGAGAIGGGVLALLLVVGLILALAWLARRMPGIGGGVAAANPALRVVGSLALGPRERVVVVAVGGTQLLLSVGAGGIRTLHTLAEPLPVNDSAPSSFANLLAQHFGKKP